ncbi:MAG: type II toxin-antitoxin system VapC family toxin [Verrucomicrobia bacterium]|nr:type II toxin-antitoxin system VapC family toxin [Verrucomicrobiota bacterium]
MITAVDTNIILDVLIPGEPFGESSKMLLDRHLSKGKLIISEIVFTELAAGFPSESELKSFLADTGMRLVYSNAKALFLAGSRWAEYARKGERNRFSCGKCGHYFEIPCPRCAAKLSKRFHVLADFLIGAHALVHADCILSRDLGIYKTYFNDLQVIGSIQRETET